MRRVVLFFTLTLFVVGLTLPTTSFAGDNARSKALTHKTLAEKQSPGTQICHSSNKPAINGEASVLQSIRKFLILKLHTIGITIIDVPAIDPDGPLMLRTPPGSETVSPDMDDGGWTEEIK